MPTTTGINVRVHDVRTVAHGIIAIELRAVDGYELLPFSAGSHIDVELPVRDAHGHFVVRQYSLCNDPAERDRYVIAVGRDPDSRGGSAYLHDKLVVGEELHISTPRNHFQLYEAAASTVFVAGGIGITPLLAMARRLSTLRREWKLFYCAKTPENAAFLDELKSLPGQVIPVFSDVPGGERIDLAKVMAETSRETHLYCCGPSSLMEAFEKAAAARASETVHVEWFKPRAHQASAPEQPDADLAFDVKLARSGMILTVAPGKSILDALVEAGIPVQYSCCDGVCGSCETRVLEGIPDHRDSVLFGEDANAKDRMMVCVSRCIGPQITLDL
jgi:ferredoxin-NADP reductase